MAEEDVRLEQQGGSAWRLELAVDGAAVAAAVARRLAEMRPRAEAPGFRRGKAPLPVLQRHFGPGVRRQQWHQLALAAVRRELAARGLRPVAAPLLEEVDGGARAAATFEVFPALPALDLAALAVRRPVAEVGESDVDYMIERLGGGVADEARRAELRRVMEAEAPEAAFEETAKAVEAALVAAHPEVPLPASLLAAQLAELRRESVAESEADEEARRRLAGALLLAEAARQEGIGVAPEELWAETERIAAGQRESQEELDRLWADGAAIQEIEENLLRRKVVAAILAKAQVADEPTSFAELARRRRA